MPDEKEKNNNDRNTGDLTEEPEKIQKERDEYLNGWQRAKAEFINYKKDEAKRFELFARIANEELMRELIIVLDSFNLAISAMESDGRTEKGVYMIKSQLEDLLKKFGLEKIEVKIGEQFDPSSQEAIVTAESEEESGIVLEEIENGYILNGKLVRPARVKLAK